jgi:hypothetical protein
VSIVDLAWIDRNDGSCGRGTNRPPVPELHRADIDHSESVAFVTVPRIREAGEMRLESLDAA